MPLIPLHPQEDERISRLHSIKLLDTPPDPAFDRIVRLAGRTLRVPIALISLVDTDRQWFKSCVGIDGSETPREHAFCAHTILQSAPLVIADTYLDQRFANNPLVVGPPYIRFYAGAPIFTRDGLPLGTLCVTDTQPKLLTAEELDTLVDLAAIASEEIQQHEALVLSRDSLHRSNAAIEESDARFYTMFELAAVGIALVSPGGNWINVNTALTNILGYSQEELQQLTSQDVTHSDDLDKDLNFLHQLVAGEIDHYQLDKRYKRKDGSPIWVGLSVTKQVTAEGETDYFIAIIEDIQARKDAEESLAALRRELELRVEERTVELRRANDMLSYSMAQQIRFEQKLLKREAELSAVLENANDAYVCIDHAGVVTAWNRVAQETFGWTAGEAIGRRLDELIIPPGMREAHRAGMKRYLSTGQAQVLNQRLELPAIRKNGSSLSVEVRIRAIDVDGQQIFSAFLHDITERKLAEATREQEALHDALTGLPNRRALFEYLPKAIAHANRNQKALAVLFLDLDGFKAVNDNLGHEAGDLLLREIASRLTDCIRQTDVVARLSGDEFIVVLEGLSTGLADAHAVAEKLFAKICNAIKIGANEVTVSASIGIAVHDNGADESADHLLKRADLAMYTAKRAGKSQIRER